MATKKKTKTKHHPIHKRHYVVHKKLEEPVHNLVGYGVLFILAMLVLYLVYNLPR